MQLEIFQVDAFSAEPFGGNPAAVIPLESWLPDDVLQRIAEENNLSETAYFVRKGETIDLRWFTPTVEVDLSDLRPIGATKATLADWSTLTDLSFTPNIPGELKTPDMKATKGWTRGTDPAIRNLRWEGGDYGATQRPPVTLTEAERTKAFNDSIKASLEQEKKDKR